MQPVPSSEAVDVAARAIAMRWRWVLATGVVGIVFGVVLLLNPISTATSLAWLIGAALIIVGIGEVAQAGRHEVRWASYVFGAIWILTGAIVVAWPGPTVVVLVRIIGIGFLIGAIAYLASVLMLFKQIQQRWLALLGAVLNLLVGILVLAWPEATVFVVTVLVGLRFLFQGIATAYFAWSIRRLA